MPYSLLLLTFASVILAKLNAYHPQSLRVLDDSSKSAKTNIDIPIKTSDADYYIYRFNDPSMFYCEKIMGPIGVSDICALENSHFTFSKSLLLSNLSSPFFLNGDRILSLYDQSVSIFGLQNEFERFRSQLITTVNISAESDTDDMLDYSYNPASQQMIALGESKIYILNAGSLSILKEVSLNSTSRTMLVDKKLFYFQNKYLLVYNKEASQLQVFRVGKDAALSLEKTYEDCQEVFVNSETAFIFTNEHIKILNKEDITLDFEYQLLNITNAGQGVVAYAKDKTTDDAKEAIVLHVEFSQEKGFKVSPLFSCPFDAKGIYFTVNNIYVEYENWVRVYPMLKDIQYSGDLYFDLVLHSPIVGVMETKEHDFLALGEGNDIALYGNSRSEFSLECKKEKTNEVAEYVFQVRCITYKCDTIDFTTQKFGNGTCSYTKNVTVYPKDERGAFGTAILVIIGLIAGVGIAMGVVVVKLYGKKKEIEVAKNAHAPKPKEKKTFNINKGLRRLQHSPSSTNETRKFLHEEDSSYPSEDMRYTMSTSMHQHREQQKKKQQIFETPRFTSFGVGGGATVQTNHHNSNYHNVNAAETPVEGELSKSSGGDEKDIDIDITDVNEKKNKASGVGKLKLGGFHNLVRDPTSFRNIGLTLPSPGKVEHKDENYQELQNENEEDEQDTGEGEKMQPDMDSGDVHSGSFSS